MSYSMTYSPEFAEKIIHGYPPNIDKIIEKFGRSTIQNAIFTYGQKCYVPQGVGIATHLEIHESVHMSQQQDPEAWWDKYLVDPAFRLEQEIEAYRAQYQWAVMYESRPVRRLLLAKIAKDLSGPLYGRIITKEAARIAITK